MAILGLFDGLVEYAAGVKTITPMSVPWHLSRLSHLDPYELLELAIYFNWNITRMARFVNRSTTTVRRHLERHLRYGRKCAGRSTYGSANPMWRKRHSPEKRREISEKVRESNSYKRRSGEFPKYVA